VKDVTAIWRKGEPATFIFLSAIRLLAAVAGLTPLFEVFRKLNRDGFNSLEPSQTFTYALVIASFLYYNPFHLFFLNRFCPIEDLLDSILRDAFFSVFLAYSILIFVPFFNLDWTHLPLYIVPFFLGIFSFVYPLAGRFLWSDPSGIVIFPENGLFRSSLIAISVILLVISIGFAFVRATDSQRSRLCFCTAVNAIASVVICAYELVGAFAVDGDSSMVYLVSRVVGVSLYTSVLFHGHRETAGELGFDELVPLDGGLREDTGIGIDEDEAV
jgi:hypothetical protein